MPTVLDLILYVLTFGSMAVLFASALGLVLWLLTVWRGLASRWGRSD